MSHVTVTSSSSCTLLLPPPLHWHWSSSPALAALATTNSTAKMYHLHYISSSSRSRSGRACPAVVCEATYEHNNSTITSTCSFTAPTQVLVLHSISGSVLPEKTEKQLCYAVLCCAMLCYASGCSMGPALTSVAAAAAAAPLTPFITLLYVAID
jgi:hypothetical protein